MLELRAPLFFKFSVLRGGGAGGSSSRKNQREYITVVTLVPASVQEARRSTRNSPRTCPIGIRRCPFPVACPSPVLGQGIVWWSGQRVSARVAASTRCSSSLPPPPPRRPRPPGSPVSPSRSRRCPRGRTASSAGPGYPETSTSPECRRNRSSGCCSR